MKKKETGKKSGKSKTLFGKSGPKAPKSGSEIIKLLQFQADILDNASLPFFATYPDGRIKIFNRACTELTGYSRPELMKMDWDKTLTPPEWRKPESEVIARLVQTGRPQKYDKEYIRKDGSRVPVEMLLHQILDAKGKRSGFYAFITDITESKQAEKALKDSEVKYRALVEDAGDAILLLDFQGNFIGANKKAEEITGYSSAEIFTMNIAQIHSRKEVGRVIEAFKEGMNTGHSSIYNVLLLRKEGKGLPVDMVGTVIEYSGKKVMQLIVRDMSEMRQAEKALRESEERFRTIFEGARDLVFIKDLSLKYFNVNPAFANYIELPVAKILGKTNAELWDEETAQSMTGDDRQALSGRTLEAEFVLKRGGERYIFDVVKVPLRDNTGKIVGLVGIARDITKRKKAEQALRESEARLRLITDHMSDSVSQLSLDGKVEYASPSSKAIAGYDPAEVEGKSGFDFIHPDDRPLVLSALQKILETHNPGKAQFRWRRKDGGYVWMETIGNCILDERGNPLKLVVNARDITERKEAERTLREREARLRLVTDNMIDMVSETTVSGIFRYVSPSYQTALGYSAGELLGKSNDDLLHPDDLEAVRANVIKSVQSRQPEKVECRLRHKDGHYIWVEAVGRFLYNDEGVAQTGIITSRNISDRKAAEQALKESESRFKMIADNMTDMVSAMTFDDILHYASLSHKAVLGYEPEEMAGQSFFNFIHSDDRALLESAIKKAMPTNDRSLAEVRCRRKDGRYIWIEVAGKFIYDENNRAVGSVFTSREITTRKATEDALAAEKEELAVTLRSLAEGVITTDTDGKVALLNKVAEELTGFSSEESVGRSLTEIFKIHDENTRRPCEYQISQMAQGQRSALETCRLLISKNGAEKLVAETSAPILNQAGKFLGAVIVFRDITERKREEMALSESEERYRLLFNRNEDGLFVAEIKDNGMPGKFIEVNDYACKMLGYSRSELLQMTPQDIVPRMDETDPSGKIDELRSGSYFLTPGAFLTKDGRRIEVEVNVHLMHLRGRRVTLASARDITERVRAEEALRQSEAQLRLLTDNMIDMVSQNSLNAVYYYVSPSHKTIMGYEPEELLGHSAFDFMHPEDIDVVRHTVSRAAKKRSDVKMEYRFRHKDGRYLWLESTGKFLFNEKGQSEKAIFSTRDITERRRMQEELQKAEKLESLGTLAGGIAHDFNNALMAILGNISFVKSELERGGDLFESLSEAESAVFRAKDLTSQLLTFSKGGSPIKKTGSLAGLIRASARYALKRADVQFKFSIAEDLWPVEFDQSQIDQVIRNVATNSEQAMPDGGTVEVSAENVTLPGQSESGLPLFPGRYVKISIKDQGMGIPEESMSRIFDPFFTTKTKGSGLGLSVAYSIVNSHHGFIRAHSQAGKGATIEIFLPAAEAVIEPKGAEEPLPDVTFHGSVLIMDDEEGVIRAAGSLFKRLGMTVQSARDGVGAIELYQQAELEGHPFDLVVMDLTIPEGLGGKETIVKLLELDPSARVVVSSGYSNDPIMSDYAKFGFKGVLAKPYKLEQVAELLIKILPEAKN